MTYLTVKKVIKNKRAILNGDEWKVFQVETKGKLDVFLLNNRITDQEYNEMMALLSEEEKAR